MSVGKAASPRITSSRGAGSRTAEEGSRLLSHEANRASILQQVEAAFVEGLAGNSVDPGLMEEVRDYYALRFDRRPGEVLSQWQERRAKVLQKVRIIAKRAVRESRRRRTAVESEGFDAAQRQVRPTVWCELDTP
ncbi:MAG: hypothetical protein AAGD01_00225 [Acidobacteriota bacterium]